MKGYLVVYEDLWGNKESFQTDKIGDTIIKICEDNDILPPEDFNFERYNSDNPHDKGVFGLGFYDVYPYIKGEDEYAGRIMVFEVDDQVWYLKRKIELLEVLMKLKIKYERTNDETYLCEVETIKDEINDIDNILREED